MSALRIATPPAALFVAAVFGFIAMGACVKGAAATIPLFEIVCVRSLIASLIIGGLMLREGMDFRGRHWPLLMNRALFGFIAMICNFYAIATLHYGDASLLVNTYPLWAVLLSAIFLGERPHARLYLWIGLAWVGVAVILRPQLAFMNLAGLVALVGAVFVAYNAVLIRKSYRHDPALRIAFYFSLFATVASVGPALATGVVPTLRDASLLLGSGIFGGLAQILLTMAYGRGSVSNLSPLSYLGVIAAFVMGWAFWNEVPTLWTAIGSMIVIGACMQILRGRDTVVVVNQT